MSSNQRVTTNFIRSNGVDVDVAYEFITKDYLMSVYPGIAQELGKTPELWIWGSNDFAYLGTNNITNSSTPVTTFAGGTNWKQVSTGNRHTAAIKTDGTLWTWGRGDFGQLGNNNQTNISTPVTTFAGGNNWKQVSCGNNHTTAIKTDGTLWTWGFGGWGQLGNAVVANRCTPVTTFAGGNNWKQASGGNIHTAAIKTDGTLWIWGPNNRLGNSQSSGVTNISTPITTFSGGTNWKQVSCGLDSTSAIKTDGTLWVWGSGSFGQLGNATIANNISTPITTFAGGNDWKQANSPLWEQATLAIKTDGTLWAWGRNANSILANNQLSGDRSTPVTTFSGGTNWKQVSGATAIKTDGTLWTWGSGFRSGANTSSTSPTPRTTFSGGSNWKQVTEGGNHVAAIQSSDFI